MTVYNFKLMKIIADNTIPYLHGIAEPFADITYLSPEQFTHESIKDADILIIRSIDKCTREMLEGTRVKLITTATIGFDHIDTDYCREAGITWFNAPGCNAQSVSQYVLSSLLTLSLREGISLKGKTLGIVGVGHVGKEVERLCSAYGMKVLRNDPPREEAEGAEGFVSLETIARESDIITFHVPLTKKGKHATWHLANKDFFSHVKKCPWFINSCRGAVHDTSALLKAKKEGILSELVIDCWENEPCIDRELLHETAIATPHIAGFSADGKANGTRICLENIGRFYNIDIEKINEVTPPVPAYPVIDLNTFTFHRMEQAVLATFLPQTVDENLRKSPEKFEWFRNNYPHPREFKAYTLINIKEEEVAFAEALGFIH